MEGAYNINYSPETFTFSENSEEEVIRASYILAKKLFFEGVRNTELKCFKSYLRDRQQLCKVNGISSKFQRNRCGVPQESYLEPLLFLLFISDMPLSLHDSKVTIYADDTSLVYASNSIAGTPMRFWKWGGPKCPNGGAFYDGTLRGILFWSRAIISLNQVISRIKIE